MPMHDARCQISLLAVALASNSNMQSMKLSFRVSCMPICISLFCGGGMDGFELMHQ
jgi:hypothetical protein